MRVVNWLASLLSMIHVELEWCFALSNMYWLYLSMSAFLRAVRQSWTTSCGPRVAYINHTAPLNNLSCQAMLMPK